jgi:4-amino-4-deoxy-L-arabinose transferase-like glycosyltransferase
MTEAVSARRLRPAAPRSPRRRRLPPPLVLALLAGFTLHAIQYFARPSLLIDEARLALNILTRSWADLLRPLDYDQTAPILFLWAEKLATTIGGANEYALRALPFAATVAVMPLMFLVARRVLGRRGAVLATAIAALSPLFLQYCRQVKPYPLDAVVTLGLIWCALEWSDDPASTRAARRVLAAGVVAMWLSTPAVFVVAGLIGALALAPKPKRPPTTFLAAVGLACGASFALAYWAVYAAPARSTYMQQFWSGSLISVWLPGWGYRAWQGAREVLWQTFVGGGTDPPQRAEYDLFVSVATAALLLLGLAGRRALAARVGPTRCALFWVPLALLLAASAAGRYPVAARVMIFAVPCLIILVTAGCARAVAAVSPRWSAPAWIAVGVCTLAPPLPLDVVLSTHARAYEDVRTAAERFGRERQAGEAIYVFAAALPAWTYYTTDWSAPDTGRLARMARLGSSGGPAFENAPSRGRAIAAEGDSLVYPLGDVREIIGLYHGAQMRSGVGPTRTEPDTNWTTNEARRIRSAANPTVWVISTHGVGLERYLYQAVGDGVLGRCVSRVYEENGAVLAQFRVEGGKAAGCGAAR